MKQGKLGIPRPLGIGLQFGTDTDRSKNVPDIVLSEYVSLVNSMLEKQKSENQEILSICYNAKESWQSTDLINETNGGLIKPKLYTIDDLNFDEDSNLLNRAFTIHTHPQRGDFISTLSIRDIVTHLSTLSTYGSNYIGDAAVVRKDGQIIMTSITSPSDINQDLKDNAWRIENALNEFLQRVESGEIQGVSGTDEFEEPVTLPGYGLQQEFNSVSGIRNKTRNELSSLGFKIQTTQL
jgi:hypothetical protein